MTLQLNKEEYLGDGLYASFDDFQLKLRAPRDFGGDHEIYLEPSVIQAFEKYLSDLKAAIEEHNAKAAEASR